MQRTVADALLPLEGREVARTSRHVHGSPMTEAEYAAVVAAAAAEVEAEMAEAEATHASQRCRAEAQRREAARVLDLPARTGGRVLGYPDRAPPSRPALGGQPARRACCDQPP
eukprot:1195663-Prorocentrum_minimum.AAC.8